MFIHHQLSFWPWAEGTFSLPGMQNRFHPLGLRIAGVVGK